MSRKGYFFAEINVEAYNQFDCLCRVRVEFVTALEPQRMPGTEREEKPCAQIVMWKYGVCA